MAIALCRGMNTLTKGGKMKTVADVKKWLSGHDGEAGDDIDEDDVEQAFLILYGRVPDEEDRAVGLFSHVCAYFL